mmetsp:Transcript_11635/g.21760  ORF Transcript_11635/g.21760 Transcript_11635/m.21760 type:complete len:361 (-) Transcript_11635:1809-2891(-)
MSFDYTVKYEEARASLLSFQLRALTLRTKVSSSGRNSSKKSNLGPKIKTVLGDDIIWDKLKLPLRGCSNKDPSQIWRCRKHKRIEATCLLSIPLGSSFLDCGSHFGDTTLTMAIHARANGRDDIRFIAFEPSRRKCKFIRAMVVANGLENSVRIVNGCVGDVWRNVRQIPEKGVERYDGRVAYSATHDHVASPFVHKSLQQQQQDKEMGNVFYFNGTSRNYPTENESDSESQSDDEMESDAGVEDVPMISLDSIQNEILPLGILHLDVEGWEAKVLRGAKEILNQVTNTCYIIAEVWDEKDRRMRRTASSFHSDGSDPEEEILNIMKDYPQFERLDDIVDQERNLFFQSRERSIHSYEEK